MDDNLLILGLIFIGFCLAHVFYRIFPFKLHNYFQCRICNHKTLSKEDGIIHILMNHPESDPKIRAIRDSMKSKTTRPIK